jgi:hypothetical protein
MRLRPVLVPEVFSEFRALALRAPDRSPGAAPAYCLFVELVDAELERRGEFWGWDPVQVDEAIALACQVVRSLTDGAEPGAAATAFASLFDALHKDQRPPHVGCQACTRPCHFRFDMAQAGATALVTQFQKIYFDPNLQARADALLDVCRKASAFAFSRSDPETRRGGGVCFAVQQLGALGLPADRQEKEARWVADALARPKPGPA